MAKKPTISNISSGYASTTTLNNNFTALRDGFDNTLSLDGSTPNSMNADFDVNGYRILNAGQVDTDALYVGGVAITSASDVDFQTTYLTASYTGDGSTVAYSLTANPQSEGNVSIYVDGVYQNKDTFSLSGTTVTFSEAPPLNAAIEIVYPTNTDTLNGSNATAITYNQGGTGAQDRNVAQKLQEFVSVKDFGAVGDGVTDDAAAIQAALDAVHAAGGGQLHFPSGTYIINSNVTVTDNTHIIGSRWGTRLYLGNTNYIHFSGDYSKIEYCEIFKDQSNGNYIIVGVDNIANPPQGRFTWINACKFDCNSMPSYVNHAQIGNYKSFDIKVTNCNFQAPALALISKYFDSQRITFTDNIVSLKVDDNYAAELVKIEAVYECFIHNNTFYSTNTTASSNLLSLLTLESGSYQTIVSNNKFINDYGYGIRVANADSPTYPPKECIIENNTFESDMTNAHCIFAGDTATTKLSINNNSFFGKTLLYSQDASFDSNFFYGVGDTANIGVKLRADNISFKNNTVTGFQYGLLLDSTSSALMDNLNISGNYFIGQDNDAVQLKYLNEYSTFTNNTIIHSTSNGNAALYCLGGGEAGDADTLTISNNTIVSPNVPAVYVNYMNGITIKPNNITAGTPYSLSNTDAYNEDHNVFTTTTIEDISARINTEGKHDGKMVFNTTTNKPVYATGSTAGAVWVDATGSTAHTPS